MKVICSYCRNDMGEKEPFEDNRISHGFCRDCYEYFSKQIAGMSFNEYLDRFEAPVLIVNDQGRIVAANKMAEQTIGKPHDQIVGFLGGEAMECAYARLPEGCGNTVHCVACSIRNTVMKTMESGELQIHVPVKLQREDQEAAMFVSTEKVGSFIRVKIEGE